MVCAVIFPLQTSKQGDPSLILLEFQGNFQSSETQVQNLKMGDITFNNDKATLVVGHHRIEGKKVKLPKPFAIIRKRPQEGEEMMDTDTATNTTSSVVYDTVTILKEKYVFSQRPGLIVQESLRGLTRIGG
ncbi:Ctf8-domain-containing protein [Phascolomyces articulosus]|uniref:Ctf8-domain-containing protein n=1 Tax=Phascolomyces articulosus TaxID=60185 RepID=A0AAD5JUQ9_9FUNG|nr:Ctf8-domain-containing protein [Phascolomyces articulosus]